MSESGNTIFWWKEEDEEKEEDSSLLYARVVIGWEYSYRMHRIPGRRKVLSNYCTLSNHGLAKAQLLQKFELIAATYHIIFANL